MPSVEWVLEHLPQLVFAFVVYSIVRAVKRAAAAKERHEAESAETDEARRIREVQERIRRAVADRRREPATPPLPTELRPPVQEAAETPPEEPLPRPVRRVIQEIERRVAPPVFVPAPSLESRTAEVARQEQLAEELRIAEENQQLAARRRSQQAAAAAQAAGSERGLLTAARTQLLVDVRDTNSLRRAFVLREVLGPPVGLR